MASIKPTLATTAAGNATATAVTNEYTDRVPRKVRTVAYFTLLISSAVVGLAVSLTSIWWPDYTMQVASTGAALLTFEGMIAGGLGVAYRPQV